MRIAIKVIEGHPINPIPALFLEVTGTNRQYLINAPSQTARFLAQSSSQLSPSLIYLFTKTSTATLSGLHCLMYQNAMYFKHSNCKLYGDGLLFNYLQQMRYKMGFGIASFSYCSWEGQHRKGISNKRLVMSLSSSQDFASRFKQLDREINQNIAKEHQNSALDLYDPQQRLIEDGLFRIRPFLVGPKSRPITNFIFNLNDQNSSKPFSGTPFKSFWVLHHQSQTILSELLQSQIVKASVGNRQAPPDIVIHLFDDISLVDSNQFHTLLNQLPNTTQHLIASHHFENQKYWNHHRHIQMVQQLQKHYPAYFPKLIDNQKDLLSSVPQKTAVDREKLSSKVVGFGNGCEYVLLPESQKGRILPEQGRQLLLLKEQHTTAQNPNTKLPSRPSIQRMLMQCDPRVIFLGTASSYSCQLRNVSSILVELQSTLAMWDCGAGSFQQFADHFGSQTEEYLLKTQVIFLTHCHGDHILGVMEFIAKRNKLKNRQQFQKIIMVVPANMVPWFHRYCLLVEDISEGCELLFIRELLKQTDTKQDLAFEQRRYKRKCPKTTISSIMRQQKELSIDFEFYKQDWLDIAKLYEQKQSKVMDMLRQWMKNNQIVEFKPISVFHCPQAYGIILEHASGVKISYSGDTRPWPAFTKAALNSTLLIHEATFSDAHPQEASNYYHSTVSEAIEVGMKSKSWKTALTHFSQQSFRVGEIVDLQEDPNWKKRDYSNHHTFIACDHLQTRLSEMKHLPAITRKISREIARLQRGK